MIIATKVKIPKSATDSPQKISRGLPVATHNTTSWLAVCFNYFLPQLSLKNAPVQEEWSMYEPQQAWYTGEVILINRRSYNLWFHTKEVLTLRTVTCSPVANASFTEGHLFSPQQSSPDPVVNCYIWERMACYWGGLVFPWNLMPVAPLLGKNLIWQAPPKFTTLMALTPSPHYPLGQTSQMSSQGAGNLWKNAGNSHSNKDCHCLVYDLARSVWSVD